MMQTNFTAPITYFLQEGRDNLEYCVKVAFQGARQHNIRKIVIFTARGEGVRLALRHLEADKQLAVQIVAVTFPAGKQFTDVTGNKFTVDIDSETQALCSREGIQIIKAH